MNAKDPCAFGVLITRSVPHILEKIFFSLDYESFKNCMHVSNSWNDLLTSESFKRMGKSVFCEDIEKEFCQISEKGNIKEAMILFSSFTVDVNCTSIWGNLGATNTKLDTTPLVLASLNGHNDMVQFLLDEGAEPNKAQACNGCTPLHAAAYKGHNAVVQLLLNEGADANQACKLGETPLDKAAWNGHKDVVQLLLDRGADPNQAYQRGVSLLHRAAAHGHKDLVQLLLDRGVDLNQADNYHLTTLHHATFWGQKDVVQLLLSRGADPNIGAAAGITPLSLALNRGHTDIIKILQDGDA